MMRLLLALVGVFTFSFSVRAQSVDDYQSFQSGNWNSTNTWSRWNGSSWINPAPSVPNFSNGVITILPSHSIDVPASYTASVDQVTVSGNGALTVKNTGLLDVRSSGGTDLTIAAADFITTFSDGLVTVESGGILKNASTISTNSSDLVFQNGAEYQHNANSGVVPSSTWQSGSTCRITGVTNAVPTGLGQSFYNFIWDCSSQSASLFLSGNLTTVDGDLTIQNTNSNFLCLGYSSGTSTGSTTVNGNVFVNNTSKLYISAVATYNLNISGNLTASSLPTGSNNFPLLGTATGTVGISVGGNVSFTSARTSRLVAATGNTTITNTGTFSISTATLEMTSSSGPSTINSTGAFSVSSGTLTMSSGTGSGTTNAYGDISVTSSTVTVTSSGNGNINFVGSGTHAFSNPSSSITNAINFSVSSSSTLDVGTSYLSGSGSFTLNGILKLGSTDALGALQNSTSAGNIRVSGTRTYASTSTIVHNGSGPQYIGVGFPSNVNLEIANSSGVTNINTGTTNLVGNLTLTAGALIIGSANTLNVQSNFIVTGGTIGGDPTASLIFSTAGALGTLTFASGTEFLSNLTVSRPGTLTLGSNLTVGGTVALNPGNLDFSGVMLTMNGSSFTGSGGLKSNSSSNLSFGGSTFSGSVPFTGSSNQLNNLAFSTNTPGGAYTWSSPVTVNGNMNLTFGALTHTSGITMAANSTINMGGGSISGTSLTAASSYNVNYTAAGNTGLELPTNATALKNLTIASSGTVTLTSGITINGTALFSGGTFAVGSNNITMNGSTWTVSGGSFSGGTGTVSFGSATTVGGSGTIGFNNLTTLNASNVTLPDGASMAADLNVNSGSTITLPSGAGNINVGGNMIVSSGSTFNNGGGKITFNGSASQSINAGGKSFNNMTVSKAGGIIDVLPTLNLTGVLTITTSTTVQSGGNIVLVSTSDGTSGTASIAAIPSGASITGNVVAQRYISAKGSVYHDTSSPVQSATVQQIMNSGISVTGFTGSSYPCSGCATNNPSMYWYDETVPGVIANGYTAITSASQTMSSGRGYNVYVRSALGAVTMSLSGVVNSGPITLPVSFTNSGNPSADGWNFVGNPYPSSINWDASSFWTKSQISGNMISVWDAGANQYKTWNGSTGSLGSGTIGQGQGFWFQCSATPTLNITEGAKASTSGAFLREASQPIHTVELILKGAGVEDRAYIQKIDGATLGFDPMDGPKLTINNFSLSTVTDNNRSLAINAVGEILSSGKIPLQIANIDSGEYTFTQQSLGDFQGVKVSILDKYTNAIHDLSNGGAYSFTFKDANSRTTDRFALIFGDNVSEYNQIALYPNPVSKTLAVYVNSNQLPRGEVIDMMGKSIGKISWEKATDGPSWTGTFDMQSQSTGVYFVKVSFNEGSQVIRFLKN